MKTRVVRKGEDAAFLEYIVCLRVAVQKIQHNAYGLPRKPDQYFWSA